MRVAGSILLTITLAAGCGDETSVPGGAGGGGGQDGSGGDQGSGAGGSTVEQSYQDALDRLDACGLATPCAAIPVVEHPTDAEDAYRCVLETLLADASGHFTTTDVVDPGTFTTTRDVYVFSASDVVVLTKNEPTPRADTLPAQYSARHCVLRAAPDFQTCLDKMDAMDSSWGDMGACHSWYEECVDVDIDAASCL